MLALIANAVEGCAPASSVRTVWRPAISNAAVARKHTIIPSRAAKFDGAGAASAFRVMEVDVGSAIAAEPC
jgi:hypothetical protein